MRFLRTKASRAALIGATLVTALATAASGRADDEIPRGDTEEKIVVMMAEGGEDESFGPIIQAVRGQLSDLPVSFEVTWVDDLGPDLPSQEEVSGQVANDVGAAVVFWCDLSHVDRMYLYIAVPEIGRVLVRRLDGSGAGGAPETIAIIVRASIDSMLRGNVDDLVSQYAAPVSEKKEPQEESEPKEPQVIESKAEPADDQENRFAVEGAYAIDILSVDQPVAHGFALAIDFYLTQAWHLFASYVFYARIEAQSRVTGVRLELARHPVSIGTRFAASLGRIYVGGAIAVNLDYITEELTTSSNMDSTAQAELEISISPIARLDVRLIADVRAFVCLGVNVPFDRAQYVTTDDQGNQITIVNTWAVRPIGRIGIAAGFL
ncbi:MAG: hypothetical protein GY854_20265 [Deltaproteobacteria bacterium]|nr:hypothetical protein [Deltaproteobacteria bacterium]